MCILFIMDIFKLRVQTEGYSLPPANPSPYPYQTLPSPIHISFVSFCGNYYFFHFRLPLPIILHFTLLAALPHKLPNSMKCSQLVLTLIKENR